MTNAIRAIEGRERTLLTALNNLTTTVCNLQNQQCATCKTVCDLSATISGAASVTKSLVHDGEDHGTKTNVGESDGVAMYDDVGVVVTVQDHIEKNVDMPPESSSPTDSSSPPVNRIMVPASPMPTMKKREVATSYAAPILQLRGTPLAPADTTGTLSDTLSDSVASSYAEVIPGQVGN